MNILFIMNGIGSVDNLPGISGGDVRWIEIAKHWQRSGHKIHVFTLQAGVELCQKLGLAATFHVFHAPNEYSLGTYITRFLRSRSIPKTLSKFHGIVYSTTEHVYDVLPALKIRGSRKNNCWVAAVHWVAPIRRKGTSWLNSILFYLNQRLGFYFIRNGADVVLAISENTSQQVKQVGIKKNVFTVDAGVDYDNIMKLSSRVKVKEFDAIFMKRFDGTKGVFDIIEIWKDVVKARRDTKLAMMGLGTKEVMSRLKTMVERYGIKNSVDFLGPIYDFNSKISILASSKLFVLPSYEENWAIAIGESLAAGVPVLCYDLLDIRSIWRNNVIWVPKGDTKKFANKVIEFLDDERARNRVSEAGMRFIKRYDWQKIADEEMKLILSSTRRVD